VTGAADTVAMLKAILAGEDFPPDGVADTPANRAEWAAIAQGIEDLPPGVLPEIPTDWTDWAADGADEAPGQPD
jgi:hypothetical protein